jgi:dephospho-CoA kinase
MIKVGITGGIGSGKSLVCQVLERFGIPVYYADAAARILMDNDPVIRHDLRAWLGEDIYAGNSLDRIKMAGLIFTNPELLKIVNRIVHPRVAADFQNWCDSSGNKPYVIQESAILFESEAYRFVDYIVLVTAPADVRQSRVMNRDGMTPEKIQAIMQNQWPDSEKASRSQFILKNDNKSLVLPRILDLHSQLSQIN